MRNGLISRFVDGIGSGREARRGPVKAKPGVESLERREVLSTAATLPVAITSAKTSDSRSVTVEYDVNSPNLPALLSFGVYRSADPTFDSGDSAITSVDIPTTSLGRPTLDLDGQDAAAPGHHRLTIAIPDGLTIVPDRPYVLAVANPDTAVGASDAATRTGVIHTHSIAAISHGGIQYKSDDHSGPWWERKMAVELKAQGYDTVIPYVWASQSRTPGKAKEQGASLARRINDAAAQFPAGDPVDVHLIGHSEGAVVISQAAQLLQVKHAAGIDNGYIKMTILDPHAANNSAPGYQYSIGKGISGAIARRAVKLFQYEANDPVVSVPPNVNSAEVFWQHTKVEATHTNGLYNLWGQVPVRGNAHYYDITGPGIAHSGAFGVPSWYLNNVVPTLGEGGHFVDPTTLTGGRQLAPGEVATKNLSTSHTHQPEFTGTSAPGATITLFAARSGSTGFKTVGHSTADTTGHWSVAPRPLSEGRYRFVVRSGVSGFASRPGVQVTPRLRLGAVNIRIPRAARLKQI